MAVIKLSRNTQFKKPPMVKPLPVNFEEQLLYSNHKLLKASEAKKVPDRSYLETTQENLNINHRRELINRLHRLSEFYKFMPETIYSAVGYVDRYLSRHKLEGMEELLLVGLCCFVIASKQQQSCVPSTQHICQTFYYYYCEEDYDQLAEFTSEQVHLMEEDILRFLGDEELTAPSAKDFLKIFVDAVISKEMKGDVYGLVALKFRCLTDYILELYLLDYTMIGYMPSVVAASAVFVGKLIFVTSHNPWNSSLKKLSGYDAWELRSCSERLISLYCQSYADIGAEAVRKKYSRREYSHAALIGCETQINPEFF